LASITSPVLRIYEVWSTSQLLSWTEKEEKKKVSFREKKGNKKKKKGYAHKLGPTYFGETRLS
jgi:hypothetical protein